LVKLLNHRTFIFILSLVMTVASWALSFLNLLPNQITDGLAVFAVTIGGVPIVLGAIKTLQTLQHLD